MQFLMVKCQTETSKHTKERKRETGREGGKKNEWVGVREIKKEKERQGGREGKKRVGGSKEDKER